MPPLTPPLSSRCLPSTHTTCLAPGVWGCRAQPRAWTIGFHWYNEYVPIEVSLGCSGPAPRQAPAVGSLTITPHQTHTHPEPDTHMCSNSFYLMSEVVPQVCGSNLAIVLFPTPQPAQVFLCSNKPRTWCVLAFSDLT